MKNLFILGSTGSIGKSTLDIVRQHPDMYKVQTLAINKNTNLLAKQVSEFKPENVVIYDKSAFDTFKSITPSLSQNISFGNKGLEDVLHRTSPDLFINAFVGFAGLQPTINAIQSKVDVALANKESLVVAGKYIMELARLHSVNIMPIDSEHSAIWQCLQGEEGNKISRLILTASGGPFRTLKKEELKSVKLSDALNHPNWKMGSKITIDSATLMNKGLEVIEAYWLYDVDISSIDVVIHPQSIIHSMIEFEDGSIKAQMGLPDMRIPIQYALSFPRRHKLKVPKLNFEDIRSLTFESPDKEKFPCLNLAYQALRKGKTYPTALNAANELAVDAFMKNQIKFVEIPDMITEALSCHKPLSGKDFNDYLESDRSTRLHLSDYINKKR